MIPAQENPPTPHFSQIITWPQRVLFSPLGQSALNALVIANQSNWETEFKALLEQVRSLFLMPNDRQCMLALYQANAFFRQPRIKEEVTLEDVRNYMRQHCHDGQVAIVETPTYDMYYHHFVITSGEYNAFGIQRSPDAPYHVLGHEPPKQYKVTDIWIRWPDHQDHSPVKRRKGGSRKAKPPTPPENHETFQYLQENPVNFTDDCVIRALASACQLSWGQVVEEIAKASGYASTTLNADNIFPQYLKQAGFQLHKPLTRNRRKLTGKQFCQELDKQLLSGERVFAWMGHTHVVAVLPFTEDAVTHYKIVDSWDSSDQKMDAYWVLPKPEPWTYKTMEEVCRAGFQIIHPVFGTGTVLSSDPEGYLQVKFLQEGCRQLETQWVLHNCKLIPPK